MASIVFAVGMMGLNLSDGTFVFNQMDSSAMTSGAGMTGHLEAIHTDSDGNILTYIQTDNAITNLGVNCSVVKLFGVTQANLDTYQVDTGCDPDGSDQTSIGLYSSDSGTVDLRLNQTANIYTTNGLDPNTDAAPTMSVVAVGQTSRSAEATVLIDSTFTSSAASQAVYGASLMNGTGATSGIFAYKDFNSANTAIILNDGDSLTVNWTIEMTGSTAINTQTNHFFIFFFYTHEKISYHIILNTHKFQDQLHH